MVAYRDCKGHLVCMADAQTGIVEIQHKDRAVRMTVPVGDSFTVTLRDTETVMTRVSTRAFHVKSHPRSISNYRTSIHHKANSSILSETHSRKYKRFVRKINMDAKNKYI